MLGMHKDGTERETGMVEEGLKEVESGKEGERET